MNGFKILSFFMSFFIAVSCSDFLEVRPPKSQVKSDVVFDNDVTATSAMLGVYVQMQKSSTFSGGDSYSIMSLAGLSSDELVNYPKTDIPSLEFERNSLSANNSVILSLWSSMYRTIYQANAVLAGLSESEGLSGDLKKQLTGEALFIRAFTHFYLVNIFGDVPLIVTPDYKNNSVVARAPSTLVYKQIIEDLELSKELLLEKYVAAKQERIRPNRFSAMAMLARVYLYLGEWEKAESYATTVIQKTDMYSLSDTVSEVFLKTSREAIWQIRPTNGSGEIGYTNEASTFSPDNAILSNVLSDSIVESFEEADARRKSWINTLVFEEDTLYVPYKYRHYEMTTFTEYSVVLRLAEMYLIRAEVRFRQGLLEGGDGALSDVNVIRRRAGLDEILSISETELLAEIFNERRLELFSEWGHRWFDLKRAEIAVEVLSASKEGFDRDDLLYPIPSSEFIKNPNLGRQNDGYGY